jgi:putative tryptophan/tyrosine transport system substrate-binding protein
MAFMPPLTEPGQSDNLSGAKLSSGLAVPMRRREFITLVGGAAAWPLAALAQQGERTRRLGALIGGDERDPERQGCVAEFREGLVEHGWVEGRNIQIDWRWAAANNVRAATYAGELVALRPDILFGDNTFVVVELQKATRSLPIVFAHVNDPIEFRFVGSLARPGGNITGFADGEPVSLTKLPEFIRQIAPQTDSVAIVVGQEPTVRSEGIARAASSIGLRAKILLVHDDHEIREAFAGLAREPNTGLIVPGDPVTLRNRGLIVDLAAQYRMPATYGAIYWATPGGLLCYGPVTGEQYRGAAGYVDRILKGARPDELPVQAPTKYELIINLKTAKALGLTVSNQMQLLADQVIE